MSASVHLSEDQVLAFRARRSGLAGPGAASAAETARILLGAQSQLLPPGLLALSQRTRNRPTAAELEAELLEAPRSLARLWGQRDTLHLYAPDDWARIIAALGRWRPGGRTSPIPEEIDLAPARECLAERGEVTRSDLEPVVRPEFLELCRERWGRDEGALRFAAGRLVWRLARLGELCLTGRRGREQVYAARALAFPGLDFDPLDGERAARELARRYLAVNGPATAHDLAHFFHASVTRARTWLETIGRETGLIQVACGGRELHAREEDLDELESEVPDGRAWPVRLLPGWDTLLMSHADKSWTVPADKERVAIWRKAGVVAPVILARGRIVATWQLEKLTHRVEVTVSPLAGWREREHLPEARAETEAVAAHYGRSECDLKTDGLQNGP